MNPQKTDPAVLRCWILAVRESVTFLPLAGSEKILKESSSPMVPGEGGFHFSFPAVNSAIVCQIRDQIKLSCAPARHVHPRGILI